MTPETNSTGAAANSTGAHGRKAEENAVMDFSLADLTGHCGVCGRPLRAVLSRAAGLGPTCAQRLGEMP